MVMTRHDNQGVKEVLRRMWALMNGGIISMGGAGYDVSYDLETKRIVRCWRMTDTAPSNFNAEPDERNTRAWSIPLIFGQPARGYDDISGDDTFSLAGLSYLLRGGSATLQTASCAWRDFRWNHAEAMPSAHDRLIYELCFATFIKLCAIIGERCA